MIFHDPDDVEARRGTHIADGGVGWGTLAYPDPARVAAINAWWANEDEEEDR